MAAAALFAVAGAFLLAFGTEKVEQSALFAAFALICAAGATYIGLAIPAPASTSDDAFESIGWGRLFVALVYAALAVECLVAMATSRDFATFVQTLHGIV